MFFKRGNRKGQFGIRQLGKLVYVISGVMFYPG